MPVSSPSYFPPNRNSDRIVGITAGQTQTGNNVFLAGFDAGIDSTSQGLICIGHNAGSGKITGQDNAILIGIDPANSLFTALTNASGVPADAPIIIGYQAAQNIASADGSIIIGSNNFGQLETATAPFGGVQKSVIIGSELLNGANLLTDPQAASESSIVIGYGNYTNNTYWSGMSNMVMIGTNIGNSNYSNSLSNSVIIGNTVCAVGIPIDAIVIGADALSACTHGAGGQYITVLGTGAAPNIVNNGDSSIFIGQNAGLHYPDKNNMVIITPDTLTGSAHDYDSVFAALATALGGANIEFCGLAANNNLTLASTINCFFLNNGVKGTVNPVNAGYFYVTGGALHWVGSNGTDTEIAVA